MHLASYNLGVLSLESSEELMRDRVVELVLDRLRRMAKRGKRRPKEPPSTVDYADPEGNVLTLRKGLSARTIAKLGEPPAGAAATTEDAWQRREEALFERLAVRWEIAGLPIDEQKLLLGRYRMASDDERRWVRATIAEHLERHIPELA